MFTKSEADIKLDAEINSLFDKLKTTKKDSPEYEKLVEHLTSLNKLKTENRSKQLSPDTMLVVAANIFGILWLARYERENVIKSKEAMKFVMKPR